MATEKDTILFLLDQIKKAGNLSAKKMFGEYAIYCDEKVVALVCDDQLFVKKTDFGKLFLQEIVEACPYPGAKPYYLISTDKWDDSNWLTELIRKTASSLPASKLSKTKRKK